MTTPRLSLRLAYVPPKETPNKIESGEVSPLAVPPFQWTERCINALRRLFG